MSTQTRNYSPNQLWERSINAAKRTILSEGYTLVSVKADVRQDERAEIIATKGGVAVAFAVRNDEKRSLDKGVIDAHLSHIRRFLIAGGKSATTLKAGVILYVANPSSLQATAEIIDEKAVVSSIGTAQARKKTQEYTQPSISFEQFVPADDAPSFDIHESWVCKKCYMEISNSNACNCDED